MAASERAATADDTSLLRLQESLSANEAILRDESEHVALRRRAYSDLLQCLEASLLQDGAAVDGDELLHRSKLLDTYGQVGLTVLSHGDLCSDSSLLYTLLRVLQQTAKRQSLHRALLLEWLPRAMLVSDADERLSREVLRILKEVLESDPAGADAILYTFTRLPLSEGGRDQVVDMLLPTLDSKKTICEPGAERLIRTLLFFVDGFTDEQLEVFWLALRRGTMPPPATASYRDSIGTSTCHDSLTSLVHMLLTNFHNDDSGLWLALSYRKHIEDQNAANSRFCTLLDVLLVILLGEELPSAHADAVDQILGRWLTDECLPMTELDHYLQHLVTSGPSNATTEATVSVRARLMQPLLQLTLFLVLAPLRYEISAKDEGDMRSLVVTIFESLDQERQIEFVLSLLNLCSPDLMADPAAKEIAVAAIHHNVITLLEAVTEAATPNQLGAIKSLLIEKLLTVSPPLSTAVFAFDHQMYVMLASLLCRVNEQNPSELEDNQEMMIFTQNLLLSPSLKSSRGGVTVDNPLVVRGIILATELVRILGTAAKVAPLKELVLKHLLPTTRVTVDPATGLAGLDFLQAWAEKYPAFKPTVFQDIKMMLANTGLVQRLNEDKSKQVAYTGVPEFINGPSAKRAQIKPMLLCVSYFMRRVTLDAPARWKNTIIWIFTLLDMYLKFGQETAPKTWQLECWLVAGIKFPASPLPTGLNENVDYLSRFDNDSLFSDLNDINYALIIDKWQKDTDGAVSLEPILEYKLSLWIAISVSAALLKNAFHHFESMSKSDGNVDTTNRILKLLQLQTLKLFDMKWRLHFAASLIRELRNKEAQASPSHRKAKNGRRSRMSLSHSEVGSGSISDISISAGTLTDLEMWFFNDEEFLSSTVLWACLSSPTDEQLIISAFSEDALCIASSDALFIKLKVHLLDHLTSRKITQHDLAAINVRLMHCLRICDFLINRLPSLRLSSSMNDTSKYSLAVSLSISYLQVLLKLYENQNDICVEKASGFIDVSHRREEEISIAYGWLKITDNEDIASCIIGILTALVTGGRNTDAIEKAIEMSWTALHTIYGSSGHLSVEKHEALTVACLYKKEYKWSDSHGKKLHRLLRESWLAKTAEKWSYMASHRRILQHFGLLLYESKLFVQNLDQITYLVADVDKCAAQLRTQCGYEEEKKESRVASKQPSLPNLPFLANATCSGIHEVTLNVVIWALAALDPVTTLKGSPFECFIRLTGLIRQLIDIFCESYHALPPAYHNSVIQAAHRALLAGVSSSHRCVEWRHQLMSLPEPADQTDRVSLCHLKSLFEATASDIMGRIFNLCDFLLAVEDRRLVARVSKLRHAANESLSSLNLLASMHNFPTLKYESSSANNRMADDGTKMRRTTGFHETQDLHDSDKAKSVPDSIESSSEGSFGVAGDWDCSDSE